MTTDTRCAHYLGTKSNLSPTLKRFTTCLPHPDSHQNDATQRDVRYWSTSQKPTFIMFPTLAVLITLQLLTLPQGVHETVKHTLVIILIFSISLLVVMLIKCGSLAVSRGSSHLKDTAPKRAREV